MGAAASVGQHPPGQEGGEEGGDMPLQPADQHLPGPLSAGLPSAGGEGGRRLSSSSAPSKDEQHQQQQASSSSQRRGEAQAGGRP